MRPSSDVVCKIFPAEEGKKQIEGIKRKHIFTLGALTEQIQQFVQLMCCVQLQPWSSQSTSPTPPIARPSTVPLIWMDFKHAVEPLCMMSHVEHNAGER